MTNYRQTMADALEFMYLMREYKLTERELTDAEKKKREEIAQDMDDADFKERYGDRWKEVKMAVATKQAKEEEFDLDEATKWKMGDGRPRGGSHIENVRFWDLSKDELQYIMKDAGEAMKANPTGRKATSGPGNYADQVNDAQTVLVWRKKNGIKEDVDLDEADWAVTFQKGSRVGARSHKIIYVQAKDEDDAVKKAKAGKGDGPKPEKGFSVSSVRKEGVAWENAQRFKVESMKAALAQIWGVKEGKNPFKKEDDDKILKKGGKTLTGKKAAEIDLSPEIKDR